MTTEIPTHFALNASSIFDDAGRFKLARFAASGKVEEHRDPLPDDLYQIHASDDGIRPIGPAAAQKSWRKVAEWTGKIPTAEFLELMAGPDPAVQRARWQGYWTIIMVMRRALDGSPAHIPAIVADPKFTKQPKGGK